MNQFDCLDVPQDVVFEFIAQSLLADGICVLNDVLGEHWNQRLLQQMLAHEDDFSRAGIGRQQDFNLDKSVRSDLVLWINDDQAECAGYLAWMAALKLYLNRRLFMGLFSYESHFAVYPAGSFYKKHIDAFKGQANRMLTSVYYLNQHWQTADGGQLAVYSPEDHGQLLMLVPPLNDRLVLFLSEDFPHEVLPAFSTRRSIAGWFRLNSSDEQRADPPQ